MVEQLPVKELVVGSSPTAGAEVTKNTRRVFFDYRGERWQALLTVGANERDVCSFSFSNFCTHNLLHYVQLWYHISNYEWTHKNTKST